MENVKKTGLSRSATKAWVHFDIWRVRLVSILAWIMGTVNVLSAILPTWMNRLSQVRNAIPMQIQVGSRLTATLWGFGLFVLASSLWRRKQAGWLVFMLLLVISTVVELFRGQSVAAALTIGLILLVLVMARSFYTHSDPPSVRRGLMALASTFILAMAIGVAGFTLERIHSQQPVSLLTAISRTMTMLASFYNPGPQLINGFGWYFSGSIYIIGIAAIGFAIFMLTRPVMIHRPAAADERRQVAEIVEKYGRSIVAPMAMFGGKQYFFSQGGSVIAYGVSGRGVLGLGDPIGPREDARAAIAAFKTYCARNDWQPSFLYVLPDGLDNYQSNGYDILCIAYEAIVPLASFSLEGHKNKDVRHHYRKIARLGYQARFYSPPLDDEILRKLRQVNDDWLITHYGGEKYFIVGSFSEEYIRNSPVIAVHAPDGNVVAFANLIISSHKSVVTGDLVRGRTKLENGTMEFLTVSMINWAISQGYQTFSLSASTTYGRGVEPNDPPVAKIIIAISGLINRFYRFRGIYVFKDKFQPRWEPRYLAFPGTVALLPALITLLRLYSGENYPWRYLKRKGN